MRGIQVVKKLRFNFPTSVLCLSLLISIQGCATAPSIPELHKAAKHGDVNTIQQLLTSGAKVDTDVDSFTPLHFAAANDHLETVNLLLENGANPNAETTRKETALFFTCSPQVAISLIQRGANVNARDRSSLTPLMKALTCKSNQEELVRVLLDAGANSHAIDKFGMTPLHFAMGFSSVRTARMLIEHSAIVNAENFQGLTPRDIAAMLGKQDQLILLDSHSGRSLYYTQKQLGQVRLHRGRYYTTKPRVTRGNRSRSGVTSAFNSLDKTSEVPAGFSNFGYGIHYSPGANTWGLRIFRNVELYGRFFAEPGHEYIIDTYSVRWDEATEYGYDYGLIIDKSNNKVVGMLY